MSHVHQHSLMLINSEKKTLLKVTNLSSVQNGIELM